MHFFDLNLIRPIENKNMFFGDNRVAEFIRLVAIFDKRVRQWCAFLDTEAFADTASSDIPDNDLYRDDFNGFDKLLTHGKPFDEMVWNSDVAEATKDIFGNMIIDDAFSCQGAFFFGIERSCVVFEILDDRVWFWPFEENFGLTFVKFVAAGHESVCSLWLAGWHPIDAGATITEAGGFDNISVTKL
jgi:hypothetical protein